MFLVYDMEDWAARADPKFAKGSGQCSFDLGVLKDSPVATPRRSISYRSVSRSPSSSDRGAKPNSRRALRLSPM